MRKALALFLGLCLSGGPLAHAAPGALAAAPAQYQDDRESGDFSPDQLDNLLGPIALYPDPLLAQVLLAATFVDDVDEAARYVRARGPEGIDDQPWDVSVKAVAHYPVVLDYLADHIDWTASLGQAYVAQSTDVMVSVQRLRQMAQSEGNLESTPEQQVYEEDDSIRIVPAQPSFIYVPQYNPAIVYYQRPVSGLAIAFGVGLVIGAWLNDDFDWRAHRVYYHGWTGGGWIGRSRPHVQVTAAYVSPRYSTVIMNRSITERQVNYGGLSRFNSVHRNVTYDRVHFDQSRRVQTPAFDTRPRSGTVIVNHNINTRDPQLDRYRGRAADSPPPARVDAPPRVEAPPRPAPHAYSRTEHGFDAEAASRRGQVSREEAKKPPEARRAPDRAVPRAEAARPHESKKDKHNK